MTPQPNEVKYPPSTRSTSTTLRTATCLYAAYASCSLSSLDFPHVRFSFCCLESDQRLTSSLVIHTAAALKYRIWWLIPTVLLAGAGEIIGWAGRLWSTYNLPDQTPFMMQYVSSAQVSLQPKEMLIFVTESCARSSRRHHY